MSYRATNQAVGGARHHVGVPNHLDFLEVLDHDTRESPSGEVETALELHQLVSKAGLAAADRRRPRGEPVSSSTSATCGRGRMEEGQQGSARHLVDRRELDSFTGFHVTPLGRKEADRIEVRPIAVRAFSIGARQERWSFGTGLAAVRSTREALTRWGASSRFSH